MAVYRPFCALRPAKELAPLVAALPYDVMSSAEARERVKGNPYSFLHIDKAEIDLPAGTGLYEDCVYEKARENLEQMTEKRIFIRDSQPCFYIYRQIMDGRAQTGLVGCASIDDYLNNVIKKHEKTRADKEADRIRHVDTCNANTGPIFLTCRGGGALRDLMQQVCTGDPLYNFDADGVQQTVWRVAEPAQLEAFSAVVQAMDSLYIADGHHRCASAVRVGMNRRAQAGSWTGAEAFNDFLSVLFPAEELKIMDYNRVVFDRNGLTVEALLAKIEGAFTVEERGMSPFAPPARHTFSMYLGGKWYLLTARPGTFPAQDVVERLDVSILQNNLLAPVLGISDPRTDQRIDFIGGIRGYAELEKRAGADGVAFAMYPTSLEELMDIADAGLVMPPKSTWFEPKLLSGLFIHEL